MDFSPDYTSRVIYTYVAAGRTHRLLMRGRLGESAVVTADRTDAAFINVVNDLGDLLPADFACTSAIYIPEASNIQFPLTPPVVTPGANAVAGYSKQDTISHLTFQGRSSGGAKYNFKLYCPQFAPDTLPETESSDFRIQPGENGTIDAAITTLNASGLPAIDGLIVIWHTFVNLKVNDFWLKKVRAGA